MAGTLPLYLDHQATTPVDPRVLDAMLPYFGEHYGNAASRTHAYGWTADAAVTVAREEVAEAIGAAPAQIVFTSGATESNNLAILGSAARRGHRRRHLITVATEHRAVLDPMAHLEAQGFRVTRLSVGRDGHLALDELSAALDDDTLLVSVMAANNEIGVLHPIERVGALCHERGVLFHCDAAQAVGKIPLAVDPIQADLLSISAHKCYGPKGVGALFVRSRRVEPAPLFFGGGHEGGLRSGTLPVPLVVGMGKALALGHSECEAEAPRLVGLRNRLLAGLRDALGETVSLNGDLEQRLPGNLNLAFAGVEADRLIADLPDLALSAGSACTSAEPEASHVLKALGLSDDAIRGSIRVGLGRGTREPDVDRSVARLAEVATLASRGESGKR